MAEITLPFNPVKRAEEVENVVMSGLKRKYYRFRAATYYGGIATADQVGCCFLCAYCWNYSRNLNPRAYGKFYSPEEVAEKLLRILERKGFTRVRISGAEPILGRRSFEHLIKTVEIILDENPGVDFILETNGLILGYRTEFIRELSRFSRIFVRVSLKGYDESSFEKISGASREFFELPLRGLKNMKKHRINAWPAIMNEIFGPRGVRKIRVKLKEFGIDPEELEVEYLERYPFVLRNLEKRNIGLYY